MKVRSVFVGMSQPIDWVEAFQKQADEEGMSFAEWAGQAMAEKLRKSNAEAAKKLSERRRAGRPVCK